MIIENVRIQPSTHQIVNGNDVYTHDPHVLVEGKDMYVKILAPDNLSITDDERILTENPYTQQTSDILFISPSQLPTDLFLRTGETLYATNLYMSSVAGVIIIHYNKEPEQTSNQPQGYNINITGSVSPSA